jgi:tetratricopeptide (TPR) repeat protein
MLTRSPPDSVLAPAAVRSNNPVFPVAETGMNNTMLARLHYWFSQLLTRIHLDQAAVAQLRRAIAADPHYAKAWRSLGFMLGNRGGNAEAVNILEHALTIEDDAITRFNLGYLYHGQQRTADAIAQFRRVVIMMPLNDRAWYGLGTCLQDAGDFAASVAPLEEAAKLQYFNPHAGYHLALAWHKLEKHAKFLAEVERVKSFDPRMAETMERDFGKH